MIHRLKISSQGQGLAEITEKIAQLIVAASVDNGLCTLFIRHTSCSLLIQENADPSARHDLERWLNRLVPENDTIYTHTLEGADDMPAHIKSMLTAVSLSIPINQGQLCLGSWQGVYLWEHRNGKHSREVIVHILAD